MPRRVRVLERAQDLALDGERALERQRPPDAAGPDDLGERLPLQQLHHEKEHAVGRAAEVGDGDDVGVIEARRGLGLALEAARHLVEAAELGVQELERQLLLEHDVLDAIDGAHAAAAERREHAVALGDEAADEWIASDGLGCASTERTGPDVATVRLFARAALGRVAR